WSSNQVVSVAFDPSLGYPQQNKIGDYIGMISLNDAACIAYSATFNGEEDVYFVRLPDLPILVAIVNTGGSVSLSWNAVVGNTYCLQFKDSLTAPWPIETNQICLEATNAEMTVSDAILPGPTQRFYQVVTTAYGYGASTPVILTQPASLTNYVSLAASLSVGAYGGAG